MRNKRLHLKDNYEFLGANGADPTLDLYLPFNMTEMGRGDQKRPCMLICPGGGYGFCSQRESEFVALQFLAHGFNAFVLTYSTETHRYPTQIREVAAALELKDHLYGGKWDWMDIAITMAGVGVGHLIRRTVL